MGVPGSEVEHGRVPSSLTHEFWLGGYPIKVEFGVGEQIDISSTYETEGLRGEPTFDAVVHFGPLFRDNKLAGSVVPREEQWKTVSQVPKGVTVGELSPEHGESIAEALDVIEEIANQGDYTDARHVRAYLMHESRVAEWQKPFESGVVPVAIVRAGIPALVASGYEPSEMTMIEEKRLRLKEDHAQVGVGLRFPNGTLESLRGKTVLIRERAQATYSSLIAFDLVMAAKGCLPRKAYWSATVGSQQGISLALQHASVMDTLYNKETVISVGRAGTVLTGGDHPYYIAREKNNDLVYCVRDGGDWGDLLVPPEYRALWKGVFSETELMALEGLATDLSSGIEVGETITIQRILELYAKAVKLAPDFNILEISRILMRA